MMMKTNEDHNPFSVPHGAPPPPPNVMPSQYQWNMVPGPNGTNVFSASSPWNVSQVGPQHFPSSPTYQWNTQPVVTGPNISNGIITPVTGEAAWHQAFIKGQPKALGIILLVTAICQILFGICLPFVASVVTFYSHIQYWGPIFYVIAGSFTIKAQQKQNIRLVKLSYGFGIFSSIISFIAMIINIVDIALLQCDENYDCFDEGVGAQTFVAMILVLHLLVFCVTVSISVFGGRALAAEPSNVPQVLVIQKMMPVPPAAYPENPSKTLTAPPPYNIQDDNCLKHTGY